MSDRIQQLLSERSAELDPALRQSSIENIKVDRAVTSKIKRILQRQWSVFDPENTQFWTLQHHQIKRPGHVPGHMLPVAKDLEQLKVVFGWSDLMYTQVLDDVRHEVHQRLDVSRPFKSSGQVRAVCDAITSKHSFLDEYTDAWPIRDMVSNVLKITSMRALN
ncbi:hypothetical protein ARMGADRAFT_1080011 [Armillaria gallica]|uniref:Uncharacterized protein n=1 Tax=Armillaria gallica TaxID=47427 RepID=A0A2H3DS97_ARMGA|nr:hypothetical protein ARMGADRAFT_1080011 [Armillaria gallica]